MEEPCAGANFSPPLLHPLSRRFCRHPHALSALRLSQMLQRTPCRSACSSHPPTVPKKPSAAYTTSVFPPTFLSLDAYIGKFTPATRHRVQRPAREVSTSPATTVEVVGPQPLVWDFMRRSLDHRSRPAHHSRRAHRRPQAGLRISPNSSACTRCRHTAASSRKNPSDPLYKESVAAIREVAKHCAANVISASSWRPARKLRPPCRAPSAMSNAAQPRRRPRHRQPHPLRQGQSRRRRRHPRPARPRRSRQGRPLAHRPRQTRRRGPHRHRPRRLHRRSSPVCAKPATPEPSPSSAKPAAHSRSKTSATKSSTSKRCSHRVT